MTTISSESRLRLSFLSLLFVYCVVFASRFLLINSLACSPDQIQALLQFKNEFDSRGCNRSDYFNGVWCDNTIGAVTKLHLSSGCLTGILKPTSKLFGFHHLRYLNLSHNNFTSSSLPSEFSNLNRLEVLSLSSNGFISQVPSSISNLSLLSSLDLSHNELTGSFPLVQNFTKLSILDLSYNHFSGTIPSSLFTMPFLSYLDLRENQLTGPIEVPNSSSSRLEHLFLGNNNFDGQILEPISNLITLKDLGMSFLNVSYPIDFRLFSSLRSLLNLELSGNVLLPESLSSDSDIPPKLYRLMLKDCNISEFPKFLKNLQNLELLSLSSNGIKGKVPEWFWSLPRLSIVNLSNNSFNGFDGSEETLSDNNISEFPKSLKQLQNLERLDLSSNGIKGKVPEWFWSLPRLSIVNLSNNSFTGFDGSEETLRDSSFTILDLSFNAFTGPLPVLPLLMDIFSAWNNSFTGDIPLSTCNRSSLTLLDLSYNNLTGPVPRCLSKLTTVNLRKNSLQGSLPDTFYSNSLLETLDVGYNQISGKLPRSLMNCSFLKFLSVEHNRIKDAFPFWLKVLPDLEVLTLRSNKFYGPISSPRGPLGFPKLRLLEISDNSFTGNLSSDYFVNWSTSSRKIIDDGQMYMGDYKHALYQYHNTLDLRYKGLYMEHESVLTLYAAIDFSGNRLGGQIPESIGLLKALIALNLSNNSFTGQIPLSFANLTELESLDMSLNKLSGEIPQELGRLSFLAYINVSNNQLKGEIPKGTQISGQPISSFEGNAELCGLPLQETCSDTSETPTQGQKKEDDKEEEEVLNWKAVAIGYFPGVLFGLTIGHVIALYNLEWLIKIIGPDKHRTAKVVSSLR